MKTFPAPSIAPPSEPKRCPKFTFGVGDRFAHQAAAQLQAFVLARNAGAEIVPVWNKSNREHLIIGSEPSDVRAVADRAVAELNWTHDYLLDADHINLATVDRFMEPCDFFTLDVADAIGQAAEPEQIKEFIDRHPELLGEIRIEGIESPFHLTRTQLEATARRYLKATLEAGRIYRHIAQRKGAIPFVTEISMDETEDAQTPADLLVILAAIADQEIPVQTLAPKFSGRFNKGVDYAGDLVQFEREFNDDLAVITHAIDAYGLPASLKLSVHSGSDKFSLYPIIRRALHRTGAGIHIKTAGTTWLEELIGLAEAGGTALDLVKEIYAEALSRREELCQPYASVIDIDLKQLPAPNEVSQWTGDEFAAALRHDRHNPRYNPHLRQLLHVGFKIAAGLGDTYLHALQENADSIGRNVTQNLFERHMKPLFL